MKKYKKKKIFSNAELLKITKFTWLNFEVVAVELGAGVVGDRSYRFLKIPNLSNLTNPVKRVNLVKIFSNWEYFHRNLDYVC